MPQYQVRYITRNVSNFNKGWETLSNILENSQSTSNKKGLGYPKKSKTLSKKEIRRNIFYPTTRPKRNNNSKTIKIWVPKTNNSLIRNKYINTFLETIHKNENYILRGILNPIGFGFLRPNS